MANLNVQLCPETGICSVIKPDGKKLDMIPAEVDQLRQASGDSQRIKSVLESIDPSFSQSMEEDELIQLSQELK